jgi:hypothetical protein
MIFTEFSHAENTVTFMQQILLGSIRVSRVVFGVPPNRFSGGTPETACGTRVLPESASGLEAIRCAEMAFSLSSLRQ